MFAIVVFSLQNGNEVNKAFTDLKFLSGFYVNNGGIVGYVILDNL